MSEEKNEEIKEEEKTKTTRKQTKPLCIGLDCGTMNLVCSKSDSDDVKITRNVFLKLDDEISIGELSDISYLKGEDGEIYIIGEDAFRFANIFGHEVSRPMKAGLISSDEVSAIDVLTLILKDLIGDVKNNDTYCSYSIPAEAIDEGRSVTYHTRVFGSILDSLGINHTPVNEAAAIVYSECQKEKFTGVGISFGAGMVNCCIMYKGVDVLKFSTARSGDWVDTKTSESLGIVANRVTSVKEKHLDLTNNAISDVKNKKTRRVIEALMYHYEALIDYTVKKLIKEFDDKVDLEIDEELPIVISGGTSMPNGFLELFKDVIGRYELPFEVSEIRRAKNPLTSVSNGLLIKTKADVSLLK